MSLVDECKPSIGVQVATRAASDKNVVVVIPHYCWAAPGTMVGAFGVGADQQDFNAELTKIKELNPEIVCFAGLTPLGIRLLNQMSRPVRSP